MGAHISVSPHQGQRDDPGDLAIRTGCDRSAGPRPEQHSEIVPIDLAIAVEVDGAAGAVTPESEQHAEVVAIDDAVAIEVSHDPPGTARSTGHGGVVNRVHAESITDDDVQVPRVHLLHDVRDQVRIGGSASSTSEIFEVTPGASGGEIAPNAASVAMGLLQANDGPPQPSTRPR